MEGSLSSKFMGTGGRQSQTPSRKYLLNASDCIR